MLRQVDLDSAEYGGTISTLSRYGTMNTSHARTTGKLLRGKVKGNARRLPRTSDASVTSECVSYTIDADGNPANVKIFATTRDSKPTKVDIDRANKLADGRARHAARHASSAGNNSDAD